MKKLIATLTHEDIADIANDMNNDFSGEKPSQGYLEYLLCRFIKIRKGVNFFKEQQEIEDEREKNDYDNRISYSGA